MSRARQLAAIMFTDIQGYTALMQQNEQKAIQARDKHRHIFNSITDKHRGKILQYYGDGTLSIFDSAIDAVNCGIEMQLGFQESPSIPVRIGIHTGDIVFSKEEIIGDSVNVASRIESLAVPGSVLISDKVFDEIKNQESIQATRLKEVKLKNVTPPIVIYAISNVGLVVPDPNELQGKIDPTPTTAKQNSQPSNQPQRSPLDSILATKLYVPPPRPKVVFRPRLIDQLIAGLHGKLTLISAPAGFGKTTLISQWLSDSMRPLAWISLDEGDKDPTRFLTYIVAALQKISSNIGEGILGMLLYPQLPPVENILTALLNEISTFPDSFVLVLDDYHLIDSKTIDNALAFLLDHLPPTMHLVIVSREDPHLPLARLRVRGQLTELRATDLRFTSSEAAGFLNQMMGLTLSADDVSALEARTEGWIAGLQMAALSLQGRSDSTHFIKEFTGSHRFVLDYLLEEVLEQQPEPIRDFLLQTAILERLNGPLCDAVTGLNTGKGMLETLERNNLFVIPLDDHRNWYRFHHLFADVLRTHAKEQQPDGISVLHQRASNWFEKNGFRNEALRHAFDANDFDRAAELAELAWPEMDARFQANTWLDWVKSLPDEWIQRRPVLSVAYAWAYLNRGDIELGEARLRDAEKWFESAENTQEPQLEMVVADKAQFQHLPASIATARGYISQAMGDVPKSIEYAQHALDLLPENDHVRRGPPAALLGLAHWGSGNLEAAFSALSEAMNNFRLVGKIQFAISGTYGLADIKIAQGRLYEAIKLYEQSLQLALKQGKPPIQGTADLYLELGAIALEQGNMEAAKNHLQTSEELGEYASLPDWPYRSSLVKAKMKEAEGDLESALHFLQEAEERYFRTPVPAFRPIAALRARVLCLQGDWQKVMSWIRERKLTLDDEVTYLSEFELLTLVRFHVSQNKDQKKIKKAMELLNRLLISAENGKRNGSLIEILIMQALAFETQDEMDLALESLEKALILAESEGYMRTFLAEGLPMIRLLNEAANRDILPQYVNHLLSPSQAVRPKILASQPLVEPLSQRELEVLQLIAHGLSNREISDRLFVALSTIKGHNRNIFDKLAVQRRTEAVAKARDLGLIER